jgi:hypothetical protein
MPEIPVSPTACRRETYIDVFQIVRSRTPESRSSFRHRAASGVIPDRMTRLRFQATRGFGIWIFLDIASVPLTHHLATVNSRARPEIDDVIGAPHRFFVVLDHDQ